MAAYDFASTRLHVEAPLAEKLPVPLAREQANYLLNVLRLGAGDEILVFNGRDGEWRARLEPDGRKAAALHPLTRTRPQPPLPDLAYLFAPLKHARLDYLVQKAVEMGAGELRPVMTRRTVPARVNGERMRANVIEAAEQCGIIAVPRVRPPEPLAAALAALEPERLLVFCDEEAERADPAASLAAAPSGTGIALLIGPEGGFAPEERALIAGRANTVRLSLGPRILRADTAAVAALALVQAVRGDWRSTERGPM